MQIATVLVTNIFLLLWIHSLFCKNNPGYQKVFIYIFTVWISVGIFNLFLDYVINFTLINNIPPLGYVLKICIFLLLGVLIEELARRYLLRKFSSGEWIIISIAIFETELIIANIYYNIIAISWFINFINYQRANNVVNYKIDYLFRILINLFSIYSSRFFAGIVHLINTYIQKSLQPNSLLYAIGVHFIYNAVSWFVVGNQISIQGPLFPFLN